MVGHLARAVSRFVAICPHVAVVHDLVTKARVELAGGFLLDLYYNPTLGKYTYALIYQSRKVYGWDNAPHHPGMVNYPHHFHDEDGNIRPSSLTGDPEQDIFFVAVQVNARLQK